MKIAYDAKRAFHNTRGLGTYSREVIRLMNAYFPENEYHLFNPKKKNELTIESRDKNSVIYPKGFIYKKIPSLWRSFGMIRDLEHIQPHIYHGLSQELPSGIHRTKIKTVVTMHDAIFMRYPELYSKSYRKIFIEKNKYACKIADKIITISQQTKKDIIHYFNADENKIQVVYQGCNNIFREEITEEQKNYVRTAYNLPEKYLLNVGAIEKRKNVELIIKAIHAGDIDTPLVIVGKPTNYINELRAFIQEFKIQKKVIFIHNAETKDLPALYAMAEIFIYPSIFEGFGIPVLEALCTKTPVIAATGSCLEETGGPSSLYVHPSDVDAMFSSIQRILANENLQSKMKEDGLIFAEQFSDINIAHNLMSVYKNLIS